jgi:hypothetical protein
MPDIVSPYPGTNILPRQDINKEVQVFPPELFALTIKNAGFRAEAVSYGIKKGLI